MGTQTQTLFNMCSVQYISMSSDYYHILEIDIVKAVPHILGSFQNG